MKNSSFNDFFFLCFTGDKPSPFQSTVAKENSEMIQSFSSIREELVVLAKVLSQAEAEKSADESDAARPDDKPEVIVMSVLNASTFGMRPLYISYFSDQVGRDK